MKIAVKICGLQDEAALRAAIDGGAAMVGFVFYPLSKNFIRIDAAQKLAAMVPAHIQKVGLFVDASDDEVKTVLKQVPLDLLQLHGVETPGYRRESDEGVAPENPRAICCHSVL